MNTITPLTGITTIGSATTKTGGQDAQQILKHGEIFKATVLEALEPKLYALDIGGNRVTAQAQSPLTIGQILHLQVVNTAPQVELRIVNDKTNTFLGKVITLIGNSIDITSLIMPLKSASPSPLDSLSTNSRQSIDFYYNFSPTELSGKDSGLIFKHLIDKLGISFEALLARGDKDTAGTTLKAALIEMARIFKGAEELSDKTNKLLNTIEFYQMAQLQLDKENLLIFPLPLAFLLKGYLILDNPPNSQNQADNAGDLHFSLHLALSDMGNLRIDFLKNPQGMYIRFTGDSQDKLDFIEQFKYDLTDSLGETPILGISFVKESIDPALDLLKLLLPEGESLVNTKV